MLGRRGFIRLFTGILAFVFSGCTRRGEGLDERIIKGGIPLERGIKSKVYLIKTKNRKDGIKQLIAKFDQGGLEGKKIALKANYNSADPFPASTHIDTLSAIVDALKENGADIVLPERSGMGDTRGVLEQMGVMELSEKKGIDVVVIDELEDDGWIKINPEGSHWKRGFLLAKDFYEADGIVQTCCLKTHQFGGHFTMSLKNSVGMVAKFDPSDGYNYMRELHGFRFQREMIAEINTAYEPEFVIMDGIKGISKGGPHAGTLIEPGILLASKDRIAIDAVGVAVLRIYGTTRQVAGGEIFEQDQIRRAAELGLGVSSPEDIELVPINDDAKDICSKIKGEF